MADRDDATSSSYTQIDRDTDTKFAHKNLGWPWLLALLLVPLLLAALLAGLRGGDIETDLKDRSLSDLKAEGIDTDGIDLDFDGRDATLKAASGAGLSKADLDKAKDVVADVEGVRVADVDTDGLADSGNGAEPTDEPTDDAAAEPTGEPSEEPSDEPSDEPSEEPTSEAAAACDPAETQAAVDEAVGDDNIQFGEGSGDLSPGGLAEVGEVAAVLAPCGDVAVTVTGFADSAGASTPLPRYRAAEVATALEEAGVTAAITATGSTEPGSLGDNSTPEGRDQNRYVTVEIG